MNYSNMTNEELIKAAREGDEYAENLLMKNNMGLISELENKFANKGIDRIELFSAGQLGLVRAYRSYNINDKSTAKFHTYAYPSIKNEMIKLFEHAARGKRNGYIISINAPIYKNSDDEEMSLEDSLKTRETNFDLVVLLNAVLDRFNSKATEQQKQVFKMYVYQGLSGGEIAKLMNVSKQAVDQMLQRIKKRYFSQLIEI